MLDEVILSHGQDFVGIFKHRILVAEVMKLCLVFLRNSATLRLTLPSKLSFAILTIHPYNWQKLGDKPLCLDSIILIDKYGHLANICLFKLLNLILFLFHIVFTKLVVNGI